MAQATQCISCGKLFPFAAFPFAGKCNSCEVTSDDPQCEGCGITFGKLVDKRCGVCALKTVQPSAVPPAPSQPLVLSAVSNALLDIPNPRAGGSQAAVATTGRFNAAIASSATILNAMKNTRNEAITRQAISGGPMPAPIPLTAQNSTGAAFGNVFITVMQMSLNGNKVNLFSPYLGVFAGATSVETVLTHIRTHIDVQCQKIFMPPKRIYDNSQIELRFLTSKLPCLPDTLDGVIWDLLIRHRGVVGCYLPVKVTKERGCNMDFHVHVTHHEISEDNQLVMQTRSMKRKASTPFLTQIHVRRASHGIATSKALFYTRIFIKETEDSEKTVGDIVQETSDSTVGIEFFDKAEIGHGEYKRAIKIRITQDGLTELYTAKLYFKGQGQGTVTEAENITLCREELERSVAARKYAQEFTKICRERGISIHDLGFLKSFIIHEDRELDRNGQAWICDRLIPGSVLKYSGTDDAGVHPITDFAGWTCDALAHFTLESSGGSCVLVDLQGIIENVAGTVPKLRLFDVQMHTQEQDAGMGDFGEEGIESFKQQHKCNTICIALKLTALQ